MRDILSRNLIRLFGGVVLSAVLASCASAAEPVQSDFTLGDDGRIYIQTVVSGQSLNALVDTGLSSPFLTTPATASRLALRFIPIVRTAPMRGVDGRGVRGRIAGVKITSLGGAPGDWDLAAVVVDVPILRAEAMVGMDFLDGYDAAFDFRLRRLTLDEPGQAETGAAGFVNCDAAKPRFSLDDRCEATAIYVDTGGQTTLINPQMAALLNVQDGSEGVPTVIRGASGREVSAIRYNRPILVRGLPVASVVVVDFPPRGGCSAPCPEMILGMDTLGQFASLRLTRKSITITP
ncbi:aspartyl protease family protein [Brevundimonas sp. SL130]|uniref:aspartyl protease family protein n=1 Tax=Brevundimonas sp. SL130 TaxID=2995143 RepID=UPI00226CF0A0|nr:aspartyl protease family protein [Brevundimonas sp. SL130]WAC61325.1 aspartyl protease family protein [Brevundimonas sp. SL130]